MTDKILIDRELLERCKLLADDPMGLDFEEHAAIYNELNAALRAAITAPQQEPVGEEVEVVAYIDNGGCLYTAKLLEVFIAESEGCKPLMTVTQHQRLLGEAKQGQRVLAMEVEQLKAEVDRLEKLAAAISDDCNTVANERNELRAQLAQKVVLPERMNVPMPIWKDARQPYGTPLNGVEIGRAEHFNLALDEVERLNGAKP
jgi:hypothetical protein